MKAATEPRDISARPAGWPARGWLVWLLLAVGAALWLLVDLWPWVADSQRVAFRSRLLYALPDWAAWLWLLPVVARWQRAWPLDAAQWRVSLAFQLAVGGGLVPAVFFGLETLRQVAANHLPLGLLGVVAREQWRARQWSWEPAFAYAGLAAGFYALDYYRRWRSEARLAAERELARARAEARVAEAELRALKQQLQPHFLFNALNSAAMLVRGGAVDQAADMLAHISALLRSLLDTARQQEVAFARELEFAQQYLEVERMRFGPKLQVRYEIAEECLAARVPSLLLQPLVENAVKHGIARRTTPGLIVVRAARRGDEFQLEVSNDPSESPPAPGGAERAHVGLANTRARLARMFGDGYALSHDFPVGAPACVAVRFPWLPAGEAPRVSP